jgi:Spy/CpxP family protein refolding chaperone
VPDPIPSIPSAKSALGHAVRRHGAGSAEATDAREKLEAAKVQARVEELVAAAPPLTPEQRSQLVAILGGAK